MFLRQRTNGKGAVIITLIGVGLDALVGLCAACHSTLGFALCAACHSTLGFVLDCFGNCSLM